MQLASLVKEIKGTGIKGVPDLNLVGITADSRQVRPGYLFVALRGTKFDGADYIADAVGRGAVAVISGSDSDDCGSAFHLAVANPALTLAEAASAFYGNPSSQLTAMGITGTNGKTTTAYMLWDVMRGIGLNPGLLGTVEYRIGARVIPSSLTTPCCVDVQKMIKDMVVSGCRSCIMEVSSHALLQHRVAHVEFDVGIFTNLTHDHLDYHKTMQNYFEAKALLFDGLGQSKAAWAVINVDDEWGAKLAKREMKADILRYGTADDADIKAEDIVVNSGGSSCMVRTPWGDTRLQLRLLGRFNISNALAAIAACGAKGGAVAEVAQILGTMENVPGRLEKVETGKEFQVFVDYAHTDDALKHVLMTLREITRNRLICVFGCGGDRDRTKRPAMGAVSSAVADYTIITSDNPRSEAPATIISEIEMGMAAEAAYGVVEGRADAIEQAVRMAEPGDIVLIAGKGHERFQQFANTTVSFDDREIVRRILS